MIPKIKVYYFVVKNGKIPYVIKKFAIYLMQANQSLILY